MNSLQKVILVIGLSTIASNFAREPEQLPVSRLACVGKLTGCSLMWFGIINSYAKLLQEHPLAELTPNQKIALTGWSCIVLGIASYISNQAGWPALKSLLGEDKPTD